MTSQPNEAAPDDGTSKKTTETMSTSRREVCLGSSKKTARSVVVPLDPSVLKLVSQMNDPSDRDDDDDDDEHYRETRCCRKYHVFCWCVTDVRRLSLIANGLYMVAATSFILMMAMPEAMGIQTEFEDDNYQEMVDNVTAGAIPRNSIGLILAVVGSVGAYRFHRWLVLAMVVWYGMYFIMSIIGKRYFGAYFAVFLIYANLALFLALKNGRITKDNYSTTSVCCSMLSRSDDTHDDEEKGGG